jgi:hypothetical protein
MVAGHRPGWSGFSALGVTLTTGGMVEVHAVDLRDVVETPR